MSGTVTVLALVDGNGRVRETRIVRSVPGLDEAARQAVRRWVFEPARAAGKPVSVWVAVPGQFKLR